MLTHTTTTLLEGLLDPANEALWRAFDARYRPIILAFAGRLGAGPEDAADVAQETLTKFLEEFRAGKYDRTRGRLRSWIVGIAKFRLADLRRAQMRRREQRGESAIVELPGEDKLGDLWDAECRSAVLAAALTELREGTKTDARTIKAFERVTLGERQPSEVADELGMSVKDVVNAKHRCLTHLRRIRKTLEELYEID